MSARRISTRHIALTLALSGGLLPFAWAATAVARDAGGRGGVQAAPSVGAPLSAPTGRRAPSALASQPGRPGRSFSPGTDTDLPTTPPPSPPPAPAPGNAATLQSPAPEAPAVAPLPQQLPTAISGGGEPPANSMALSPGGTLTSSPTEAEPSRPGGGGKSLADCMRFWEPATHMTKVQWRAACLRTMQEYPSVR